MSFLYIFFLFLTVFYLLFYRCYFTTVKTAAHPDENWKWIVQVQDISSSSTTSTTSLLGPSAAGKEVVFRSNTQIDNLFDCPLTLYSFDGKATQLLGTIAANASLYLPLSVVYGLFA